MTWDRFKNAIEAILDELLSNRLDYLARYPAVVTLQAGSILTCKPDDSRLPTLSSVSLRYGLPGTVLLVPPGSRVLIGFEEGDPSKPFAELWDTTVPLTIALTAATSLTLTAPTITVAGAVSIAGALAAGGMAPPTASPKLDFDAGLKNVEIKGAQIKLSSSGTAPVARVGDTVIVDPVTHTGTITGPGNTSVLA